VTVYRPMIRRYRAIVVDLSFPLRVLAIIGVASIVCGVLAAVVDGGRMVVDDLFPAIVGPVVDDELATADVELANILEEVNLHCAATRGTAKK